MSRKSDGVQDIVRWLEQRCKELKAEVEAAEKNVRAFGMYEDCGPGYYEQLAEAKAELRQAVSIKISTEKYMKKLRHEEAGK